MASGLGMLTVAAGFGARKTPLATTRMRERPPITVGLDCAKKFGAFGRVGSIVDACFERHFIRQRR
jgi:hypothetical protein